MSELSESAPLIDVGELEELLGSDNELLAQIVELFAETYAETQCSKTSRVNSPARTYAQRHGC